MGNYIFNNNEPLTVEQLSLLLQQADISSSFGNSQSKLCSQKFFTDNLNAANIKVQATAEFENAETLQGVLNFFSSVLRGEKSFYKLSAKKINIVEE